MTNEEKIKSLSTNNFAVWLTKHTHDGYCVFCKYYSRSCFKGRKCYEGIALWLKSEESDSNDSSRTD